jgi:hypothetical protein
VCVVDGNGLIRLTPTGGIRTTFAVVGKGLLGDAPFCQENAVFAVITWLSREIERRCVSVARSRKLIRGVRMRVSVGSICGWGVSCG